MPVVSHVFPLPGGSGGLFPPVSSPLFEHAYEITAMIAMVLNTFFMVLFFIVRSFWCGEQIACPCKPENIFQKLVDCYRKSRVMEKYKPVLVIGILPMPIFFTGAFKYGSILTFIFGERVNL